uniref:Uncharacterized protein n=1 Tax=Panagrolaimus sp. PS1159 TaxID=55785 RepID=A0AC35G8C5_9BILA
MNRSGNKLTASGLYSSSLITNNNENNNIFSQQQSSRQHSVSPQRQSLFQSHHSYFTNEQKVTKILEESAKSKGFLIKFLFVTQEAISSHLMSLFNSEKIRQNLRWLSKDIHVAGTDEQLALMNRLQQEYENLGFDVTPYEYEVLLNYPDYNHPNTIHLWDSLDWELISDGKAKFNGHEKFGDEIFDERSKVWWNAYANNGTAIGNIVYANYGTEEDYLDLEKQNISLRGKISLVRYGGVFRGDKAQGAEKRGASGVIIYSDPADFVINANATFPEDIWLPKSAAQRGTLLRTVGDPQTPNFPSKDYTFREFSEEDLRSKGILPTIPVMPIGYEDAEKIMKVLDGPEATWARWRGSMPVTYRLTGNAIFRLDVRSFSQKRKIKNVVAIFRGSEEPDRFVALTNHVDAWVKGSIDPNTGTATQLEIARVVKEAYDYTGWRPRRSLAFCLFDAEEFGLIGSTEFVEEMLRSLQARAVAIINVDNINGNSTLSVKAVPLLYRAIVKAAGKIGHPNPTEIQNGRPTLLDSWRFYNPKGPLPGDKSVPSIGLPASGSDHQRFIVYAGIPVADIRIESAPIYTYMLYHTMYEIPWTVENFLDPSGEVLVSMGKLWLELTFSLSTNLVIPFGIDDYGLFLGEQFKKLKTNLIYLGIDTIIGEKTFISMMKSLGKSITDFHQLSRAFQQIISSTNSGDRSLTVKQIEMLNSRLMGIERAFILDYGISSERSFQRHSIFSSLENDDLNSGGCFALIIDPVSHLLMAETDFEKSEWIKNIKMGFTRLQYTIESATQFLQLDGF